MKAELKKIPISEISNDERFRYSDERFDKEKLLFSIKENGILNPILVLKNDFVPFGGFRRLDIAKELGIKEILSNIFDISSDDAFLISITENLSHRRINIYEKSICLLKLRKEKIKEDKIIKILQIPPSKRIIELYFWIAKQKKEFIDFIVKKDTPLRKIEHLTGFKKDEMDLIINKILPLNPTISIFEEITKNILEISRRDGISLDLILNNETSLNELRKHIFNKRYPVLSKLRDLIENEIDKIKEKNISVIWDKNLEDESLKIILDFKNIEEFQNAIKKLSLNTEKIKTILAVLKEGM